MDGRWVTVIALLIAPAVLMGVTVVYFASNPISILAEFGAMLAGGFYLVSYTSTFSGADSAA
jgi:hypothetical protein